MKSREKDEAWFEEVKGKPIRWNNWKKDWFIIPETIEFSDTISTKIIGTMFPKNIQNHWFVCGRFEEYNWSFNEDAWKEQLFNEFMKKELS